MTPSRADMHVLIGKTGGTAVRHVLEPFAAERPWLHLHRYPVRPADVPPGERVVFFLRNGAVAQANLRKWQARDHAAIAACAALARARGAGWPIARDNDPEATA